MGCQSSIKGLHIFTNKHNQVDFKRSREMVKRIGLVLMFFFVFFPQLIGYVLYIFWVREERFTKHFMWLNLDQMWIRTDWADVLMQICCFTLRKSIELLIHWHFPDVFCSKSTRKSNICHCATQPPPPVLCEPRLVTVAPRLNARLGACKGWGVSVSISCS